MGFKKGEAATEARLTLYRQLRRARNGLQKFLLASRSLIAPLASRAFEKILLTSRNTLGIRVDTTSGSSIRDLPAKIGQHLEPRSRRSMPQIPNRAKSQLGPKLPEVARDRDDVDRTSHAVPCIF